MRYAITIIMMIMPAIIAQTKPVEGLRDHLPGLHALTNAKVVRAPGDVLENGTIIIRDGIIEAVGTAITPPQAAQVWDYSGKTIYPGLIDVFSNLGMSEKNGEHKNETGGAAHWNEKVDAQHRATDAFSVKDSDLNNLHKQGFTAAWIVPQSGNFRGNSAVIALGGSDLSEQIIRQDVAQHISFQRSGGGYPSSLMGIIALIRQTFLDAKWYQQAHSAWDLNMAQPAPETNDALAALADAIAGQQPVVFEVGDDLEYLRAVAIAKEFNLNIWVKASGMEYRIADAVQQYAFPVITPLNFPEKLNAETPEDAIDLDLQELQHWYFAPENPAILAAHNVSQLFTREGLDKKQDFHKQLRKAIERGLSEDAALAALTTHAATLLGVDDQIGSIANGKRADLLITNGNLFDDDRTIIDVWVNGKRSQITAPPELDARGKYDLKLNIPQHSLSVSGTLNITGKPEKLSAELETVTEKKIKFDNIKLDHRRLFLNLSGDSLGLPGMLLLSAARDGNNWKGSGLAPDGQSFEWMATQTEPPAPVEKKSKKDTVQVEPYQPKAGWGAYNRKAMLVQPAVVVFKNATIWTSASQGIVQNADLLIRAGKIVEIGQNISAPKGALVIDATGKHITPGLIDAHSHTGIDRGVNEATQAVTAEVRIGDVVDSYDISWYRELAGGLTAANQLHGSANPMGGQNSVVKLRWGAMPEAMKIAGAPGGIKFALGENVKQSNWGDDNTTRYPQTRMGVETIMRDRFRAARDYRDAWNRYNALNKKAQLRTVPPRRDLELDALLEIINGERLVHSHSYRQDEILMLCRIAQDFGFKIGTFQHVLEGYKVAETIKEAAIGASAFSDWWAFKFEVYDAIPYNGAIMHRVGVNVSFNSDSNELARRLNTEAAKAIKYGGVAPQEALKFVTLNPAIQLGIADKTGSLEVGKDADIAVWNGDPLSTYTRCEQTWVDGRKMFDREDDMQLRQQVATERADLIQRYLATANGKSGGKVFTMKKSGEYSCRHDGHDH